MKRGPLARGLIGLLLTLVMSACDNRAEGDRQETEGGFRGYTESVGIVFETVRRWTTITEGRPEAIQDETLALHYAVARLGISLMPWEEGRKERETADVMRQTTTALALAGTRSQGAWEAYLTQRADEYERALPTPRESWLDLSPSGWGAYEIQLSEDQLRQIGRVLVDGVLHHRRAPDTTPSDVDGWTLSVGEYFRSRLNQLMQEIEGMPG